MDDATLAHIHSTSAEGYSDGIWHQLPYSPAEAARYSGHVDVPPREFCSTSQHPPRLDWMLSSCWSRRTFQWLHNRFSMVGSLRYYVEFKPEPVWGLQRNDRSAMDGKFWSDIQLGFEPRLAFSRSNGRSTMVRCIWEWMAFMS